MYRVRFGVIMDRVMYRVRFGVIMDRVMYRVRFGVNIEKMMYRVRLLPNPNPKHGQSEHSIAWDKGQVRPLRPFRFVSLVSTTDLIHIDRANILQMS